MTMNISIRLPRIINDLKYQHPRLLRFLSYFLFGLIINLVFNWRLDLIYFVLFIVFIIFGGWRITRVALLTCRRDLRGLIYLIKMGITLRHYQRSKINILTLFNRIVKKYPDKTALVMIGDRSWTFREIDDYSNKIANYFYSIGYRKGDIVAIFMENRPEFIISWIGLSKIGIISALINFNLKHEALSHCIKVSKAKSLIFSSDLSEVVFESYKLFPATLTHYLIGQPLANHISFKNINHLNSVINNQLSTPPPQDHVTLFNEKLLYIYTSGTTGLPKAAVIIHSRYYYMSNSIYYFYNMTPNDIIYDTLPLYHSAGGILGVGNCLLKGCTVVIRKKFSASNFWKDCIENKCTVAQYIGEICRYLLAQPSSPHDKNHSVRLMYGNGIRPQIWQEFKERFNINQIGEFYGATEGNANIINIDNTVGAIGFQTRLFPSLYPVTLIKVDPISGEPIRNKHGRCIRCDPGEPGELVGKIIKNKPLRSFDGYANKEANKKKITKDVFKKGDKFFLTGDILEMDELGYMYFRDRTGDTFRWKGENVSTAEVEAIISNIINFTDSTVYGVEIPGAEGRAGMVAIAADERGCDLNYLNFQLKKSLPSYAIPIFIRIVGQLNLTSTFKLKKLEYKKQGFNPKIIKDFLYYLNLKTNNYEELNDNIYNNIMNKKIRF